jgi:protein SCO1/2
MTTPLKFLSLAALFVIVAAGTATALYLRHAAPRADLTTGTLIEPARELKDFSLIDYDYRKFGSANLRGHWSILFFGYTHCPEFCPATLATLAALRKRLRSDPGAVSPQVIFVSVDAKRDTPEQLKRYVPRFDPSFIGLTATDQPQIEAIAKNFGVAVGIRAGSKDDYIIDHSTAIFIMDPFGKIAAVLTGPFSVDALLNDFRLILAARA